MNERKVALDGRQHRSRGVLPTCTVRPRIVNRRDEPHRPLHATDMTEAIAFEAHRFVRTERIPGWLCDPGSSPAQDPACSAH